MMPIGSPPNLIVFTSGKITMMDMVKHGAVMTIISIVVILLLSFTYVPLIFGYDFTTFPEKLNVTSAF